MSDVQCPESSENRVLRYNSRVSHAIPVRNFAPLAFALSLILSAFVSQSLAVRHERLIDS